MWDASADGGAPVSLLLHVAFDGAVGVARREERRVSLMKISELCRDLIADSALPFRSRGSTLGKLEGLLSVVSKLLRLLECLPQLPQGGLGVAHVLQVPLVLGRLFEDAKVMADFSGTHSESLADGVELGRDSRIGGVVVGLLDQVQVMSAKMVLLELLNPVEFVQNVVGFDGRDLLLMMD